MEIVAKKNRLVGAAEPTWQAIIKSSFRDPKSFCASLNLPESMADEVTESHAHFRLFCPQPFWQRIRPADPDDPLFRQVWPDKKELESIQGDRNPLTEDRFQLAPGLLQKYESRALLVTTGACAVHCRYCFRRFFPYHESPKSIDQWLPALNQIAADSSLTEVILSGGDPWMLTDNHLENLIREIESIEHIKRLRIHTRLPVVIPQRVTHSLLDILESCRLAVVVVIHTNHVNEIDGAVEQSLKQLAKGGVTLLNQTVLLRDVNDNATALIRLSERLVACQVVPYYLHHLDPVAGAEHFAVGIERGKQIIEQMRSQVSGYLVPRFVQERPGNDSKSILK